MKTFRSKQCYCITVYRHYLWTVKDFFNRYAFFLITRQNNKTFQVINLWNFVYSRILSLPTLWVHLQCSIRLCLLSPHVLASDSKCQLPRSHSRPWHPGTHLSWVTPRCVPAHDLPLIICLRCLALSYHTVPLNVRTYARTCACADFHT